MIYQSGETESKIKTLLLQQLFRSEFMTFFFISQKDMSTMVERKQRPEQKQPHYDEIMQTTCKHTATQKHIVMIVLTECWLQLCNQTLNCFYLFRLNSLITLVIPLKSL